MIDLISNIMTYLNPVSETVILFIMIGFDTAMGGKWRKHQDLALNSNGAFNGSPMKAVIMLFPLGIGLIGVGLNAIPPELFMGMYVFPMIIFELMALAVFAWAAWWTYVSISANMKLAGMPVPPLFKNAVEAELNSKLKRHGLPPINELVKNPNE